MHKNTRVFLSCQYLHNIMLFFCLSMVRNRLQASQFKSPSHAKEVISPCLTFLMTCASSVCDQQHANVSSSATVSLGFQMSSIFLPSIRFSQITKPRSKPQASEMDVSRPQWQAVSTGVSIISLPGSSQAILLKVLDACKLLTAAVNTSL